MKLTVKKLQVLNVPFRFLYECPFVCPLFKYSYIIYIGVTNIVFISESYKYNYIYLNCLFFKQYDRYIY